MSEALRPPRLPLEPLLPHLRAAALELMQYTGHAGRAIDGPTWVAMATVAGVDTRQLYRWHEYGVTALQADRLACAVGLHPLLVWPEWHRVQELEPAPA